MGSIHIVSRQSKEISIDTRIFSRISFTEYALLHFSKGEKISVVTDISREDANNLRYHQGQGFNIWDAEELDYDNCKEELDEGKGYRYNVTLEFTVIDKEHIINITDSNDGRIPPPNDDDPDHSTHFE